MIYAESSDIPTMEASELNQRAARVKLLLMDVDGVLTDGKLHYAPGPGGGVVETKAFDSQDGIALRWALTAGMKTGMISGGDSEVVEARAQRLGCSYVYQRRLEKIPVLEEILAKEGIGPEAVAYIGDDLTDAVIMRRVGISFATANARPEVKRVADIVTVNRGGQGAVREVVELLLKARGEWENILRHYEVD